MKNAFVEQVRIYDAEIRRAAEYLRSVSHNLAFIGCIGVGKTTAICSLADLRLRADPSPQGPVNLAQQMAMEVGGGGTTICEVRVVTGPRLGIVVEPQSDDAIRLDVADFCEYLVQSVREKKIDGGGEDIGTNPETERAIRNMSGLRVITRKDEAGKRRRSDPAKDLARDSGDAKLLAIEILTRMNLAQRQSRTVWYPSNSTLSDLEWLQKTFADINNGRNSDFPIPRLIEIVVPQGALGSDDLDITLIDTKGIDQSGHRADLECHFDDPRTVVVLCSSFKDAPAQTIQSMLQRMTEAGASDGVRRTCLLVLPMPGEAISVKDASGEAASDDQEGYEIKRDHQIDVALARLSVPELPVFFFNAMYDEFEPVRQAIVQQILAVRQRYSERLRELESTVNQLIANRAKEEVQAVLNNAIRSIQVWLDKNVDIGEISDRVHSTLIAAIGSTHVRSIWASVRRHGGWTNLDYYYQLGFGARSIAAKHIKKRLEELKVIIDHMLSNDELASAHDFLRQVEREIDGEMNNALRWVQMAGRAEFEDALKEDTRFWTDCDAEWGLGPGYRDKIATNSHRWFVAESRQAREEEVRKSVVEAWSRICASLRCTVGRVSTASA